MRPSSVDTSEPAWVKRKTLSTKSSTSWRCTSRKYSAIVSADSATRRRTPGGSSIWPKTSAVFSRTPDSFISSQRSLPSRVRSPTPANTDDATVLLGDAVDHLLDDDGLADAGAAEHADLAALDVGLEQVDDLDAGLEDLGLRLEVLEARRLAVDRPVVVGLDLGPCRRRAARRARCRRGRGRRCRPAP